MMTHENDWWRGTSCRIHKGSMYDTFVYKQTFYVNTLEHYFEIGQLIIKSGITDTAIRFIFNWAIEQEEDFPLGCLIVNTAKVIDQTCIHIW